MARVVLILLVVLVAAWWLVGRQRRVRKDGKQPPPARSDGGPEEMLRCAHCGVHLPRGDAVLDGAQAYCSSAHRAAGPRAR